MNPFRRLATCLIPFPYSDVDTDQIIPARYLKVTGKAGLAEGLFSEWRYLPDGSPKSDFPLNQAMYRNCQALLAGDNFGCGSSREHAAWALAGWGFRAIVSTSFADIFCNNALKNGLLPVIVDTANHTRLFRLCAASTPVKVDIDLATQTLTTPDGESVTFPIDPFHKTCLLEGLDSLGYLLKHEAEIATYENHNRTVLYSG